MILEIDAGNSRIKWRLLANDKVIERGFLSSRADIVEYFQSQAWLQSIQKVRVASVTGVSVEQKLRQVFAQVELHFAQSSSHAAQVTNIYADPALLGVDRWLAMLAAFNDCKQSCAVIDIGTAITLDFIAAEGCHQGGYILPGIRMMQQSLVEDVAGILLQPDLGAAELGKDTLSAVQNGSVFVLAALEHKLLAELEQRSIERLYITGGDAQHLSLLCEKGIWRNDLVFEGLALACP